MTCCYWRPSTPQGFRCYVRGRPSSGRFLGGGSHQHAGGWAASRRLPRAAWRSGARSGGARHLECVVLNLMSNAIKFTEDERTVICRLASSPTHVFINVSDTGISIPVVEQKQPFEQSLRGSGARDRAIQGAGRGLHIVATIVSNHGADIPVNSLTGRGTTFTVRLPRLSPQQTRAQGTARDRSRPGVRHDQGHLPIERAGAGGSPVGRSGRCRTRRRVRRADMDEKHRYRRPFLTDEPPSLLSYRRKVATALLNGPRSTAGSCFAGQNLSSIGCRN